MQKFKITLLALAFVAVAGLTACGGDSNDTPQPEVRATTEATTEVEAVTEAETETETEAEPTQVYEYEYDYDYDYDFDYNYDYEYFTHPTYGFTIGVAPEWVNLADRGIATEDFLDMASDIMGGDFGALLDAAAVPLTGIAVIWADPFMSNDNFMGNINVVVTPNEGLTQEMLMEDGVVEVIGEILAEALSGMFEYFNLTNVYGISLGENTFMVTRAATEMMGIPQEMMQFMTMVGPNTYTITFTSAAGLMDAEFAYDVLETFRSANQ